MNAEPLLARVARVLSEVRLEAILIGNAAAALQGAPVTTLDFDFCVRDTSTVARKIRAMADRLDAVVSQPHEPVSEMTRLEREDIGLQVDFLPDRAIGVKFASLRSRASRVAVGGHAIAVADLQDVADAKRKANRPKDKAALYVIETTLRVRARPTRSSQRNR